MFLHIPLGTTPLKIARCWSFKIKSKSYKLAKQQQKLPVETDSML